MQYYFANNPKKIPFKSILNDFMYPERKYHAFCTCRFYIESKCNQWTVIVLIIQTLAASTFIYNPFHWTNKCIGQYSDTKTSFEINKVHDKTFWFMHRFCMTFLLCIIVNTNCQTKYCQTTAISHQMKKKGDFFFSFLLIHFI